MSIFNGSLTFSASFLSIWHSPGTIDFVWLKDGVYSVDVEKSLLGAEINQIVDSISFGWYKSIFQSYMADKVRTSPIYNCLVG